MATKFYTDGNDFFQVVKETKCTVTVRPVTSKCVETVEVRTAFDYDQLFEAVENDFTSTFYMESEGKRCKKSSNGSICVNNYWNIYAYPSDGRELVTRDFG